MARKKAPAPKKPIGDRGPMYFFTTRMDRSNRVLAALRRFFASLRNRWRRYLERRPHRSLRLTPRSSMPKSPVLPGYVALSRSVWLLMRRYRSAYLWMLVWYTVLSAALVGFVQQDIYRGLSDNLKEAGPELIGGNIDGAMQSVVLFGTAVTGALNTQMDGVQQLYFVLLFLLTWMSVVWFLRQRLADNEVGLRDAIYQSGAPVVSTGLVLLYGALQTIPFILILILYQVLRETEVISYGFMAMMGGMGIAIVGLLTLYFLTSTFMALIIVTIPGAYPMVAIRTASDIAFGKRVPLTARLVWLFGVLLLGWAIVLIPTILLADIIPAQYAWVPIVPVVAQLLSSASVIYGASYVYVMYRRLIDEPVGD